MGTYTIELWSMPSDERTKSHAFQRRYDSDVWNLIGGDLDGERRGSRECRRLVNDNISRSSKNRVVHQWWPPCPQKRLLSRQLELAKQK